jgi:hypothetical protein
MVAGRYIGDVLDSHHAVITLGIAPVCGTCGVLWLVLARARLWIVQLL